MQDQVSICLPDRSFLTCHYKPHMKEILRFFQELITVFHISNWNLCLIASTQQCANVAELLWGSEVVTAKTWSCPLAWPSPGACCTVPHGVVEMWPRTVRGRGWTWRATFSPAVKGSGYVTTERISNSCTLMVPANPGEQVAKPQVFVLQVGRCRRVRVPQHGAAGTHREPPLHGRAKLAPTPAAARDASASGESEVN